MPNPAIIAVTGADGVCRGFWLHLCTRPNQAGAILRQHYNSQSAAEALAVQGSVLCLDNTLGACSCFPARFQPIAAPTAAVLFKHMNIGGDCIYGYHWNGQQWTIHDIGLQWNF